LRDEPNFRERIKGVDDGVVVYAILPNGPAAKSELHTNDIIVAVDGRRVATPQELRVEIRRKKLGEPVALEISATANREGGSQTRGMAGRNHGRIEQPAPLALEYSRS